MPDECDGKTIHTGIANVIEEETTIEMWHAPTIDDLEKIMKSNPKPHFTFQGAKKRTIDWSKCKCPDGCRRMVRDSNTIKGARQIKLKRRLNTAGNQVSFEITKIVTTWSEVAVKYVCVKETVEKEVSKTIRTGVLDRRIAYVYKKMREELVSDLVTSIQKKG
jgi:hypothetical protein